jgi:thiamine-phosphate pyrophosphorylase
VPLPNSLVLDSDPGSERKPILCYVTDRRSLEASRQPDLIEALLEKIELAAAAGVDWIQIREKDLSGKQSLLLVEKALDRVLRLPSHRQAAAGKPPRILVNDRLDVALAARARGLHLGENSMPAREAKRLLLSSPAAETFAHEFILGVSCHSLEAAKAAASSGANYIFFGPVFATPSKAAYGSPQGLDHLAAVCSSVEIPVLAIGGITPGNASSCLSAGASGIAAIRLFQDSADLRSIVRAIRPKNS